MRHVVQDLVSEIFFEEMQTNNQNPWPELNPFVLQAVQSGKESVIEVGIHAFQ